MTLKQKFQKEIETESTASVNMGDVLSWGVLIFGEGQGIQTAELDRRDQVTATGPGPVPFARGEQRSIIR